MHEAVYERPVLKVTCHTEFKSKNCFITRRLGEPSRKGKLAFTLLFKMPTQPPSSCGGVGVGLRLTRTYT